MDPYPYHRFAVVSRLGKNDVWMMYGFGSTLEEAETAEIEEAQKLVDLGWHEAEVNIVAFNAYGLMQLDGWRGKGIRDSGEDLHIQVREPYTAILQIQATHPAH